ncbi:WavE lipopolysaccharide synthesis [Candidatus Nanopelagicaceae bacterium]
MSLRLLRRILKSLLRRTHAIKVDMTSKLLANLNLAILMDSMLARYYEKTSNFITWDVTPLRGFKDSSSKTKDNIYLNRKLSTNDSRPFSNPFGDDLAVVIQGQIIVRNNLTKDIVHYYLKNFQQIKIILSTWADTPEDVISEFNSFLTNPRFEMVLSTPPQTPGVFNINNQIVSSQRGLESAIGVATFAIKTRTDQLLSSPSLLRNLYSIWLAYGERNEADLKIVVSSLNTFGFRFYGASDMFQFSKAKTLLHYWEQPLDYRPASELTQQSNCMRTEGKKRVAEVYLNTNYFQKIRGTAPSFSWKENLQFIRDSFVIIDQQALGQIWAKNTNLSNRWKSGLFPHKYYEFSHLDWLGMSNSFNQWIDFDSLLDSEDFFQNG